MREYDVYIKADGKRSAHVVVTLIPGPERARPINVCKHDYVKTFFGSATEKAKLRAADIIKNWEKEMREEEEALTYRVKGDV